MPTSWKVGGYELGFALNPRGGSDSVQAGDKVDLPAWLAVGDYGLGRNGLVGVDKPRLFSNKLQKSLEADPRCVSLSAQSPYFYELALQLGLNDTLQETFQHRYQKLLTPAGCWSEEAWGKVKERLTVEECALVLEAREAYARFRAWRQRHCKPASGAHPIVSNKRKRVQTFGSSDRARHHRVL